MTKKPAKISDQELKSMVDQEAWAALGYVGKLTEQRRRALEYYEAKATGKLSPPEVEGRSAVVSPDVANAVEWAMPSLMRIFASGDKVVSFEPRKMGAEKQAEMATDYVNWLYWTQNEGFKITYWWIKDALLSKNGVVKVYSDNITEVTQEDYDGLTESAMANIVKSDEVEVLEHTEEPDDADAEHRQEAEAQAAQMEQAGQVQQAMQIRQQLAATPPAVMHGIKIKRTRKNKRVCVVNIPPEEFLISRLAKSVDDTPFAGHRVQRTLSELVAMGYDKAQVERLADDNNWAQYNSEAVERRVNDDEWLTQNYNQGDHDPMLRRVWLIEAYMRVDYDSDGFSEWRKIVKAGFEILENEMCDGPPFADMTPIMMPHRFFGKSLADVTADWQEVKTALLRQLLDALYLGNNPRYEAVENQVNFDDLLTSRPGGVVRVKNPGMVKPLQTADVSGQAITGLEYVEKILSDRSGVDKGNAGLDANTLQNTAVGTMNMAQQAAMQKLELMARVFAETGFKRLYRLMLKCATRYQDKAAQIRLNGKWVEIDPREWIDGFDLSINVGLGTGNRDQQAAQLKDLMLVQQALVQYGIVTPANLYETVKKLPNVLGYKNEEQFFTDPAQAQQQSPKPDPEQIKMQGQMQIEQMKEQGRQKSEQARMQMEHQLEQSRMQMQAQVDSHRQQVEAQQQALKMQQEKELEQFKAQLADQAEARKAEYAMQTAIAVARINAEAKISAAEMQASQTPSTLTPEQGTAAQETAQ